MVNILCIDNSKTIRQVIKDCVLDLNYGFYEAENGLTGLTLAPSIDNLGMIIVDWNMPAMSGKETLRRSARYATADCESCKPNSRSSRRSFKRYNPSGACLRKRSSPRTLRRLSLTGPASPWEDCLRGKERSCCAKWRSSTQLKGCSLLRVSTTAPWMMWLRMPNSAKVRFIFISKAKQRSVYRFY